MLIDPASKVSVPLTVVMRTWVRVSDRVFDPELQKDLSAVVDPKHPKCVQELPPTRFNTDVPLYTAACSGPVPVSKNPAVELEDPKLEVTRTPDTPIYPDVSKPPASPSLKSQLLVPLVLTPSNITVILFAQDGIPVKSMLVPLVLA